MKKEPTILEPWLSVEPWRYANDATDEESLIAARLASHALWARRRFWLRARAAVFGRRKNRRSRGDQPEQLAPPRTQNLAQ